MKQMQEEKSAEMIKMQEITVMRKKNEGLQVMFNEALGRNTQLLNKKQAEGFTPRAAMQDPRQILPDFEKKNTEL